MMFSSLVIFIWGINRYDFFTHGVISYDVEASGGARWDVLEQSEICLWNVAAEGQGRTRMGLYGPGFWCCRH